MGKRRESVKRCQLADYQKIGSQFLVDIYKNEFFGGDILADDMGMEKTGKTKLESGPEPNFKSTALN